MCSLVQPAKAPVLLRGRRAGRTRLRMQLNPSTQIKAGIKTVYDVHVCWWILRPSSFDPFRFFCLVGVDFIFLRGSLVLHRRVNVMACFLVLHRPLYKLSSGEDHVDGKDRHQKTYQNQHGHYVPSAHDITVVSTGRLF